MYEEERDLENDEVLESLMQLLKRIPKNTITMLNIPKYAAVLTSVNQIVKHVKADYPDAEASLEFDGLTGTTLILTIVADGMNIYDIKNFCSALSVANTMDVIPLEDEKIQIGFTYHDVKVPVPPSSMT